jgi:hypothetical protein
MSDRFAKEVAQAKYDEWCLKNESDYEPPLPLNERLE